MTNARCGYCGELFDARCPRCNRTVTWGKDDSDDWYANWHCSYCGIIYRIANCPKCGSPNVGHHCTDKCYISTACCDYKHLPDDCDILTTMRTFRDQYGVIEHPEEVEEYYELAPAVVHRINESNNREEIYNGIYNTLIRIVSLVKTNKLEDAYHEYKKMTKELEETFGTKTRSL